MKPARLPVSLRRLFWEVDPASVDLEAHREYVMERVMTRGGWQAMRWLRRTYPAAALAAFLRRAGDRLAPRERAYWALIAGLPPDDRLGGGRPPWAG